MWSFYFLAKAQYDNAEFLLCANAMRSKWQNAPSLQVDIFATATPCNPLGRLFCKRLNMTKPLPSLCYKNAFCPSLRAVFTETAWQSINLNANLPLDCHEFARLRFANSRNDKTASHTDKFVILTCLVILSVSEVSINLKCFEFCGFFCYGLRLATHLVAMLKMTFFIITSKLNALRGKSQRLFLPWKSSAFFGVLSSNFRHFWWVLMVKPLVFSAFCSL